MNKLRIGVTMPDSLAKRIDQERKDIPRSRYIVRLLEKALSIPTKERTEYD